MMPATTSRVAATPLYVNERTRRKAKESLRVHPLAGGGAIARRLAELAGSGT